MYICICNAVTDRDIRRCAERGACSLRDLRDELGVASNCGKCKQAAKAVLREARSEGSTLAAAQPA
jgi:bacterioferritin-associated ferredoxin